MKKLQIKTSFEKTEPDLKWPFLYLSIIMVPFAFTTPHKETVTTLTWRVHLNICIYIIFM